MFLTRKFVNAAFVSRKFVKTRSSIALKDLLCKLSWSDVGSPRCRVNAVRDLSLHSHEQLSPVISRSICNCFPELLIVDTSKMVEIGWRNICDNMDDDYVEERHKMVEDSSGYLQ